MNNIFANITPLNLIIMLVLTGIMIWLAFYVEKFRKEHLKIAENKKKFLTVSSIYGAILFIVIIGALFTGKVNFSLEFTGGTMLEIGFPVKDEASKAAIPDNLRKAMEEYNASTPEIEYNYTVQPEGTPKTIDYPNKMRKVNLVITKNGGTVAKSDVKGIAAVFVDRFGKVKFLEDSFVEKDGKVSFTLLMEQNPDVFRSQVIDSNTDGKEGGEVKRHNYFADPSDITAIVKSFNESFDVDFNATEISIPEEYNQNDNFDAVFVKVSKRARNSNDKAVNLTNEEVNKILQYIAKNSNGNSGSLYLFKKESIGPSIGKELATNAAIALIVALLVQLIYISIRFNKKWYYGLAADIGLVHDLIVMFGIYILMDLEFDSPFVSAMMTIIGYSVMNSIVIFDRIREDMKLKVNPDFNEIVNISCSQTMTRSVNTLITVLMTLFALYLFGGKTLQSFAFALSVGCIAGGYSSVFLVPSILIDFEKNHKETEEENATERRVRLEQAAEARRIRRKHAEDELPPEKENDVEEDENENDSEETSTQAPVRRRRVISRRKRR